MTSTTATIFPARRDDLVGADSSCSDVIHGLSGLRRTSLQVFLRRRGSALFDEICELDEYYLTRTELAILREHMPPRWPTASARIAS